MADKVPVHTRQLAVNTMEIVCRMREEKKHCDFLMKVGSTEISAHRNILCANSDFFDKMLSHSTVENKSGVVEMKDVDPECANICINHMYGEEVSIPHEKYEPMMFIVTMMQLHTLRHAILTLLEKGMNAKSFYVAMRIADIYECKKLEEKCTKFAEENFGSISQEEEFGKLEKSYIKEMMKPKNMKMSEEEKLKAVLKWVGSDSKRSKSLVEMMKWVDLSKVTVEYRRHLIEEDSYVFESRECLRLLSTSVIDSLQSRAGKAVSPEKAIMIFDKTSGCLQLWNPKANMWKRMQEMDDDMKKNCFSAVKLVDHIYVLMQNQSVYRLKPLGETLKWERMANMVDGHGVCPPATVFSDMIYVIGGHNGESTATVEKYNPVENKWTKLENKPQESKWAEVLAFEEYIYLFGGMVDGKLSNKVSKFKPTSSTWSDLAPMKVAQGYAAAVEYSRKIHLLGSHIVEVYDIESDTWTTLQPMTVARSWLRGFVIGGCMYAVGGYNSSPGSIEKYDFDKEEWVMVEFPKGMKVQILESCEVGLP